jgi:hypothetical protein
MKLILTALAALALPGCVHTARYEPVPPAGLYQWHYIDPRTEYTVQPGESQLICIDHEGEEVPRYFCSLVNRRAADGH